MKQKVKCFLLVILIFAATTLGYQDAIEVDEEVYAVTLGIDTGVANKVRITVQFPTYKGGGGTGGTSGIGKKDGGKEEESGEVDGTVVTTIDASTILEAISLLDTALARKVSLKHVKMLVISEDFARRGIEIYLAPMGRFREVRRVTSVIVCIGTAAEFIRENKSLIGESASKAIELLMAQSGFSGYFEDVSFHEFYTDALSPYGQSYAAYAGVNDFSHLQALTPGMEGPFVSEYDILPGNLPRVGASKREVAGLAVFNGARMVGSLSLFETRYFLMLTGRFRRGIITLEDRNAPGNAIPLDLRPGRKPHVKARFEGGIPVIDVDIVMEADIGAIQSRIQYESMKNIRELNRQVEEHLGKGMLETVRKTQQELRADIFKFGSKVAGLFNTIPEWEQYRWLDRYPEAKVNVNVKVNVRRTGLMIGSSPIQAARE